MDLIGITKGNVARAGSGSHAPGLKAVLLHIETAVSHLYRGQEASDDAAFTDVIYRTNQAFEGSLKEAYRVLTSENPERKKPHEIEQYLAESGVFRKRVMDLFTNYRKEWRNPSAHDHRLDFDSSEAFLAIVSVCAFANLLLEQVIEKLSHDRSKIAADGLKNRVAAATVNREADFALYVGGLVGTFAREFPQSEQEPMRREAELLGELSGFIESVAPGIVIDHHVTLGDGRHLQADMVLTRSGERLVLEIKAARLADRSVGYGLEQMDRYLSASGIGEGVLAFIGSRPKAAEVSEAETPSGRRVVVVGQRRE